jgi:hypothetical protein
VPWREFTRVELAKKSLVVGNMPVIAIESAEKTIGDEITPGSGVPRLGFAGKLL